MVRTVLSALVAVAALGAAAGSGRVFDADRQRRVAREAGRAAEQAVQRGRDALAAQLESVQLTAQAASTTPALVSAVRGRVDRRTLGDLFSTESWWEPYRKKVTVGLVYEAADLYFSQGDELSGTPFGELLNAARAKGAPISRLFARPGAPVAIAASPVGGVRTADAALLVVARPLDAQAMAARAAGPIVVSDGRKALASAGAGPAAEHLRIAVGREALGVHTGDDPAQAAAATLVAPGLWLWAGADVGPFALEETRAVSTRKTIAWGAAVALALAVLAWPMLGRRSPPVPSVTGSTAAPPGPTRTGGLHVETPVGAGLQLGRYILLDRIGEGGMAEIFTAASFGSADFRRQVVVKRLRPEMHANAEAVAQFIDEANLASSLVHPNIVPVFDFGEAGGHYFIALEYIVGRDLGRLNRRLVELGEPALSPRAILYVAHEVLSGLEYAHRKLDDDGTPLELVHRDISPENVMVSDRGEVKLLDFGIVKAAQRRVTRTEVGFVKGNVDFMSPEQARGRGIDQRADLFSLGLVLYYCVAQAPMYGGETTYDRLMKAAAGLDARDLAKIAALPAPLDEILSRALAYDPDQRYPSAGDFQSAVAAHIEGGREELARAIGKLFERELHGEQERLGAAFPRRPTNGRAEPAA